MTFFENYYVVANALRMFVCLWLVGWLVNGIATNKHKQIVLKVSSARPTLIPPDEKKDFEAGGEWFLRA